MHKLFLIRHGETIWSRSGQHTSYTDLELTEHGIKEASLIKGALPPFNQVFISPLKRAKQTAEILGLKGPILKELTEWNYGIYEGKTTKEIREKVPDWTIFTHGALFGETIEEVEIRAKKVIHHVQSFDGSICLISSGHFIRALIASYLDVPCSFGRHIVVSTASVSILGTEKGIKVVETLNQKY
jgi:probable phosphoglycerate mutase